MPEWWIANGTENQLKGVEGEDLNVPRLPDDYIIDFLRRVPAARESFERLYPTMLPEEQERLAMLAASAQVLIRDPTIQDDVFQRNQNTPGVHTVGPEWGEE